MTKRIVIQTPIINKSKQTMNKVPHQTEEKNKKLSSKAIVRQIMYKTQTVSV